MTLILAFTSALLLLSQTVYAQSGTCAALRQQGTKYTGSNNRQYVLACNNELQSIGDVANRKTSNMADCLRACDGVNGCNAVTYWPSDQTCWMKKVNSGRDLKFTTYSSGNQPDTAYLSTLTACSTLFSDSTQIQYTNTRQYTISCDADFPGVADITNINTASLVECLNACENTATCTSVVFWDTYSTCYLKAMVGRGVDPAPATGGMLMYVSSMTTCNALIAQGRRVQLPGNRDYTIQCNADAPGAGDVGAAKVGSLNECMQACDKQSGCNAAFFYRDGSMCYMKGLAKGANIQYSDGGDMIYLTSLGIGSAFPSKDQTGQWGKVINFPLVPVAAAPIPNSNKVFVWSANYVDSFSVNDANQQFTLSATLDLTSGSVSQQTISNTGHDMFCPGISFDPSGRLVVTGGSTQSAASIFDSSANSWTRAADMNIPRGYHSTVITSAGKIFALGGSWVGGIGGKMGELYDPKANTWTKLPGCPTDPMQTNDQKGTYRADNHAWLFGWKNGVVFQAGPSKAMNWFSPSGSGSYTSAGNRANAQDAMNGNAVMYDAPAGKILTVGGATSYDNVAASSQAHLITLGDSNATPQVKQLSNMAYTRTFGNSVALPNGEVFVTGGQAFANLFTDYQAGFYSEMWNPTSQSFRVLEAMDPVARTYHSVAILLPDATVLSGGGGLCGGCNWNHKDAAIYTPPYLFRGNNAATRPRISAVSTTTFVAGTKFTVTTGSLTYSSTATFSVMRAGSATHTVDTDQRRIPLTATKSGNTYTMQLPSDYGILPAGWYMLFAMDDGVPSVATWIRVRLS